MEINVVKERITKEELKKIAEESFGDMVKAAIDVDKEIIALGGEFHSDANEVLIREGSEQKYIWGINIYPDKPKEERIEYNSLINIRPLANNRSMEVEGREIREKIKQIVDKLIE